eukprot:5204517-Amphidinium_carterae.2
MEDLLRVPDTPPTPFQTHRPHRLHVEKMTDNPGDNQETESIYHQQEAVEPPLGPLVTEHLEAPVSPEEIRMSEHGYNTDRNWAQSLTRRLNENLTPWLTFSRCTWCREWTSNRYCTQCSYAVCSFHSTLVERKPKVPLDGRIRARNFYHENCPCVPSVP